MIVQEYRTAIANLAAGRGSRGMAAKEAKARIKINKLLEAAGWRFFDEAEGKANIVLEPNVKITTAKLNALGENFDAATNGFV